MLKFVDNNQIYMRKDEGYMDPSQEGKEQNSTVAYTNYVQPLRACYMVLFNLYCPKTFEKKIPEMCLHSFGASMGSFENFLSAGVVL